MAALHSGYAGWIRTGLYVVFWAIALFVGLAHEGGEIKEWNKSVNSFAVVQVGLLASDLLVYAGQRFTADGDKLTYKGYMLDSLRELFILAGGATGLVGFVFAAGKFQGNHSEGRVQLVAYSYLATAILGFARSLNIDRKNARMPLGMDENAEIEDLEHLGPGAKYTRVPQGVPNAHFLY